MARAAVLPPSRLSPTLPLLPLLLLLLQETGENARMPSSVLRKEGTGHRPPPHSQLPEAPSLVPLSRLALLIEIPSTHRALSPSLLISLSAPRLITSAHSNLGFCPPPPPSAWKGLNPPHPVPITYPESGFPSLLPPPRLRNVENVPPTHASWRVVMVRRDDTPLLFFPYPSCRVGHLRPGENWAREDPRRGVGELGL